MGQVYMQKWEESERCCGCKPDGYSLHLTEEDAKQYIKEYWDSLPSTVPDDYSRPCGNLEKIEVSEVTYNEVKESRDGIRRFRPISQYHRV